VARFSASVQTDSRAHPACYTMGACCLPGVKRPGRGVDHSASYSAEFKERVEVYLYSPSGPLILNPGAKRLGIGVDNPPSYSAEVKEKVELYLYSPSGSSWLILR
jgi:hypothetical protein